MRQPLPYVPDLGDRLRSCTPSHAKAVWLRPGTAEREIFGAFPVESLVLTNQLDSEDTKSRFSDSPYHQSFWIRLRHRLENLPRPSDIDDLPFRGGGLGFIGYENSPIASIQSFPTAFIGIYPRFISIDHLGQKAEFISLEGYEAETADWAELLTNAGLVAKPEHRLERFSLTSAFDPLTTQSTYRMHFQRIQDYLRRGDCYQVNYAQAFKARCQGSSAAAMAQLLAKSAPAYAAWVSLPEGDVLSLSPELFLKVEDGGITTKPIKGTAPRDSEPAEDARLRQRLEHSPKELAENLMIVDLLRHDIGQHAQTGSVRVEKLFEVESLPQVHHLVSTVTARLAEGSHVIDLIRDCFPGGSITGAPKKRAMEIIAELEPTPRSIYCGSIGFINVDGDAHFNIAIRTMLRLGDELYAWAGGGIVADSDCESEYQECFHKMGALMRVLEEME